MEPTADLRSRLITVLIDPSAFASFFNETFTAHEKLRASCTLFSDIMGRVVPEEDDEIITEEDPEDAYQEQFMLVLAEVLREDGNRIAREKLFDHVEHAFKSDYSYYRFIVRSFASIEFIFKKFPGLFGLAEENKTGESFDGNKKVELAGKLIHAWIKFGTTFESAKNEALVTLNRSEK